MDEMKTELELQVDEGGVITHPVTGWGTKPLDGMMVLLAIQYVETPEQLENGERLQIQGLLNADKALELAEALKRAATIAINPPPSGTMH